MPTSMPNKNIFGEKCSRDYFKKSNYVYKPTIPYRVCMNARSNRLFTSDRCWDVHMNDPDHRPWPRLLTFQENRAPVFPLYCSTSRNITPTRGPAWWPRASAAVHSVTTHPITLLCVQHCPICGTTHMAHGDTATATSRKTGKHVSMRIDALKMFRISFFRHLLVDWTVQRERFHRKARAQTGETNYLPVVCFLVKR